MNRKTALRVLVIALTGLVSLSNAQPADSILDRIARSLPQMDAGWTYEITPFSKRHDGSRQASVKWKNGSNESGATVIMYPNLKSAQRAFQPSGKEDLQDEFRVAGVGDEAFLWPPKAPTGGAYNMRFRKAQVEIWMSGPTEEEVKDHATRIAAAIAPRKHD